LVVLDDTRAILADIIIDRVIDLLERLLLIPPLRIILIDDVLHARQPLLLPLADLPRQFAATVFAVARLATRSVH